MKLCENFQVLVPKDASLLGKTFEVDIIATGKHFMKGEVVKDSLVHTVPRPKPLPPGSVSGVQVWKSRTNSCQEEQKSSMDVSLLHRGSVDIGLLLLAATVILVVLLVRLIT